ncbi:hypothetical protein M422DRAFT_271360 [Sphaerobolus stellatus SS14]|uniref:Uncharacterized protein n=1 Tax=Sphaerobolus stellatus (strain SS14) TaxID=990650 RepID=A0A0C9UPS4_SPHS4|nr:hypothetical protein M422DRAFT_271360 [Sphaerobolus stellatus SS14]
MPYSLASIVALNHYDYDAQFSLFTPLNYNHALLLQTTSCNLYSLWHTSNWCAHFDLVGAGKTVVASTIVRRTGASRYFFRHTDAASQNLDAHSQNNLKARRPQTTHGRSAILLIRAFSETPPLFLCLWNVAMID